MTRYSFFGGEHLSDEELIKIFLLNGGEICMNNFSIPTGIDSESEKAKYVFSLIENRPSAKLHMMRLQQKLCRIQKDRVSNLGDLYHLIKSG